MTHNEYTMLRNDYKNILRLLYGISTYFTMEKPLSALPLNILHLLTNLEDANYASTLLELDKTSVKVFTEDVRLFCNLYSGIHTKKKNYSSYPFREGNENQEMQNTCQELHEQYLDLKTNLSVSLRNVAVEYRIARHPCTSYCQEKISLSNQA